MKWLPIESAPKNGTVLIGMDDLGRVFTTWYFAPSSQTFGWLASGHTGYRRDHPPIWWMPLPEPPK